MASNVRKEIVAPIHDAMEQVMFHMTEALHGTDSEALSAVSTILGRLLGSALTLGIPESEIDAVLARVKSYALEVREQLNAAEEGKGVTRQ